MVLLVFRKMDLENVMHEDFVYFQVGRVRESSFATFHKLRIEFSQRVFREISRTDKFFIEFSEDCYFASSFRIEPIKEGDNVLRRQLYAKVFWISRC